MAIDSILGNVIQRLHSNLTPSSQEKTGVIVSSESKQPLRIKGRDMTYT